jgi:hypothetical protein
LVTRIGYSQQDFGFRNLTVPAKKHFSMAQKQFPSLSKVV